MSQQQNIVIGHVTYFFLNVFVNEATYELQK